ncbi:alkaline phosphatase D family protein [Parasphingorhabdus cellanae]|uniref:Alkaline phosphatase D family protein n=1 Tax=Parasphingorhabdus cellanae TaxID=2806553 RepID=A0ABX7T5M9_9SPHN|nr:alkaline phosphatase D family protein [Parasphingorhabdus cellanae]QTD56899.1 alkaline phosphatase D family protein [Parasphingorhabdus cellanae]
MADLRSRRLDMSRRHALKTFGGGAIAALGLTIGAPLLAAPVFRTYPFQLGVASGEPAPDGFVIWTRLAPDPLSIGYGMPAAAVEVEWLVASDERMRDIVARGTAYARPELGHAVHVAVAGLEPNRPYWYRFVVGRERSAIGRSRTTPSVGQPLDRLRFAVAGCQNYEEGYYTAHRFLAAEEADFVYCYGDYIYEYRENRFRNRSKGPVEVVRPHAGDEIYTIDDYRRRYAQYKMDVDLQAAHAAAPWFMTWDDHEIDNNWVGAIDQDGTPEALFNLRRQMAVQAYYEHMPLRASALPVGPAMQLYRQAQFGDLMDFNLLDTRQYRTDQPCDDKWGIPCKDIDGDNAQVLGQRQESWLFNKLGSSNARWQVLAQQVMMMDLDRMPGPEHTENLDSWAGYRVPRNRVLEQITTLGLDSVVVLTGDEHQNYAGELHMDGRRPGSKPIATEFVATSISSGGDGEDQRESTKAIQRENASLKWHNSQRGYVVCDVKSDRWMTEFKTVDCVTERGGQLRTRKRMTVEHGAPDSLSDG